MFLHGWERDETGCLFGNDIFSCLSLFVSFLFPVLVDIQMYMGKYTIAVVDGCQLKAGAIQVRGRYFASAYMRDVN